PPLKAQPAPVPIPEKKRTISVNPVLKDCPSGHPPPTMHLPMPRPPLDCCFPETHQLNWATKRDQPWEPAFGPLPTAAYPLVPRGPRAARPTVGWENQTWGQEN